MDANQVELLSKLQTELDTCAEDGTIQEGAYLRLCNITKEMKQKQDGGQRELLKNMYVDMIIQNPCIVSILDGALSFYDDDVRKVVFDEAKKPSAKIFKRWWIDLIWFWLSMTHDMAESDINYTSLHLEREVFLELIENMPNTLEHQKHIVDFFLDKKFGFFKIFFNDPEGEDDDDDDEGRVEAKLYGEAVLKACPYLIVLFVKNSDATYLSNYKSFRATARRHATEELYSDPEFEAALPKVKPKSLKRRRNEARNNCL